MCRYQFIFCEQRLCYCGLSVIAWQQSQGFDMISREVFDKFEKATTTLLSLVPQTLTMSLTLVTVQALLRPLRPGEVRADLAAQAKAQVGGQHCGVAVQLPAGVDMLLQKELVPDAAQVAQPAGRSSVATKSSR